MIKKCRKQLLAVATLICFFAATLTGSCLFASSSDAVGDYTITNYDVNINITEENFYEVEESIFVNFPVPKHGIFRFIPYRFSENRNVFPRVENINVVGHPFDVSSSSSDGNSFKEIKIGDKDKTLTGSFVYKLGFDYKVGKIPGDQQYIYYNIMGNMSTPIEKGRIRIQLPKAVDDSKIEFFQGPVGSTQTFTNFGYDEQTNAIIADLNKPLGSNEYLTVFIPVPDDYFSAATILPSTYDSWLPGYLILTVGILIVIGLLWFFFGRSKKIVSIVEFYPPDGLSPIAVDKLLRESDLDVITPDKVKKCSSLFYYLANKGYLTISFEDKEKFTLVKTDKPMGAEADHIVYFYNNIFKDSDVVTTDDIKKDYYETASNTITMLPQSKVIDKKSTGFMILGLILSCLPMIPIFIGLADKTIAGMFAAVFVWVISLIVFCVAGSVLEKSISGIGRGKGWSTITYIGVAVVGSLILFVAGGMVSLVILYLLFAVSFLWSFFIRKRNDDKVMLLGRLKGFRIFIEKAKKDELEKLINESPMYFYDILPYAHVFGVTKTWIDKFKNIEVVQPEWYQGNSGIPFTYLWLYGGLMNSMDSVVGAGVQKAISDFNASGGGKGGGGFSGGGGGFSGGGFGGGGGGSW